MPFGLRNAGQSFQRFMNQVCRGLDFVFIYIDDLLIFSRSSEEHREHLKVIFQRLTEFGLTINLQKCLFGVSKLDFLSHEVSEDGIVPSKDKVVIIEQFPTPNSIRQAQRFLGMVNYYHRFVPQLANYLAPIHEHLARLPKKGKAKEFSWPEECQIMFEETKKALANASMLVHPDENAELSITADASNISVGAVLQQRRGNNSWVPLSFFSKKLTSAEQKYAAFDRELLAIFLAIKHFRYFVEGRNFTIYTDHKPLINAIFSKTERSPRQSRHLDYIAQFSTDIRYIKGADNVVADTLSRVSDCSEEAAIDHNSFSFEKLSKLQLNDEELNNLQKQTNTSFKHLLINIPATGVKIWCEISTGSSRPYVPSELRRTVFHSLHGLSHPGIRGTRKLVSSKYFWPGMNKDINLWSRECLKCQRAKVHRHTRSEYGKFELPEHRFEHIHMDIVGPLPPSEGYTYLLTLVDRYTRWPEAYPMKDMSTVTVVKVFVAEYIFRFGCPKRITTDRGAQFESRLFQELTKLLGIHRIRTTSYHPQANGLVERFHRTLKASIYSKDNMQWMNELPIILLGIRVAIKEEMKCCPADLVYGQSLCVPGELFTGSSDMVISQSDFVEKLRGHFKKVRPAECKNNSRNTVYIPTSLESCDFVFVRVDKIRTGLSPPYEGPYKIIKKLRKQFIVDINGTNQTISIDRLKPAYLQTDAICANKSSNNNDLICHLT